MNQTAASVLVGLAVCLGAATGNAESQTGTTSKVAAADDVVALKNGGMLRGQISEKVPDSHVVLVTLTGEIKRFAWDEVEYAGPASGWQKDAESEGDETEERASAKDSDEDEVRPKVTVHAEAARLTFKDPAGYTLHIRSGSAIAAGRGGVAFAKGYDEICTAPCEATVPAGTHTLALSKPGAGVPVESSPVQVPAGNSQVLATYHDRKGTRVTGLVVMIGGVVAGTALMMNGLFNGDEVCNEWGYCHNEMNTGMVLGGTGVSLGGLLLGMILAFQPDSTEIEMKKNDAANSANLRRVARRAPSVPGLSFRGVW